MSNITLEPAVHSASGEPIRVTWAGNPWGLAGLCLLNILLVILTVGIYWFWARTEYRRRMWQMVRVNGEPLAYTGTGLELLIGYLKLFLFVILPALAVLIAGELALGPKNPVVIALILVVYVAFFFLYFAGIFRANRYILSRTRWRGIAFGLSEGAIGYAWTSVWTAFVTGLTLGWLLPWRTMALRRRLTQAMHFGSAKLRFEGHAAPLYGPFTLLWFSIMLVYGGFFAIQIMLIKTQAFEPGKGVPLRWEDVPHAAVWVIAAAIPLVFVGLTWFEARKLNVFAQATKSGGLGAHLEATGGSVLWLTVSNMLILLLSVGILRPVTQARRLRYLVDRFSFSGSMDLDEVLRGADEAGSQGAGLEAAFSIEIF